MCEGLGERGVLGKLSNQLCCAQWGQFAGVGAGAGRGWAFGETPAAPQHPAESGCFRLVEEGQVWTSGSFLAG